MDGWSADTTRTVRGVIVVEEKEKEEEEEEDDDDGGGGGGWSFARVARNES